MAVVSIEGPFDDPLFDESKRLRERELLPFLYQENHPEDFPFFVLSQRFLVRDNHDASQVGFELGDIAEPWMVPDNTNETLRKGIGTEGFEE